MCDLSLKTGKLMAFALKKDTEVLPLQHQIEQLYTTYK
jgi:hypothetical protein